MARSFFFYDLETSGIDSRRQRIMQFAGQRTDENLKPIGKPYNILIKLTEDVLPQPDAVMLTGITPQKTLEEGITEAEFCKLFYDEIVQPDTCFTGFNSIRFDDEFMRHLLYRNFYDPYEWQWKNGCSRWDLLDVTRMTRALRPGAIKWPFDEKGTCTNKLELLTKENNLMHDAAHDALSDVLATIAVADMVKKSQPKLFDYLFTMRNKRDVTAFLAKGQPFVYSSGRYPGEFLKTTIAYNLGPHPNKGGVLVYNLRVDPTPFIKMNAKELAEAWRYKEDPEALRLPVKAIQINRAPAIAPLNVLDAESTERLKLDLEQIKKHQKIIDDDGQLYSKLRDAADYMNKARSEEAALFSGLKTPDEQLYDDFISDYDKKVAEKVVSSKPQEISASASSLKDERLKNLLPLYKARNFPAFLTDEERVAWEEHRKHVLLGGGAESQLAKFGKRLNELAAETTDSNKQYLLEELRLYAESIAPDIEA